MNTLKTLAVILLATLATAACDDASTNSAAVTHTAAGKDLTTLNFSVTGMHCEGCVMTVRNAIAKLDGVQSCDVSLKNESASVQASDEQVAQQIIDAVAALDFTIERTE